MRNAAKEIIQSWSDAIKSTAPLFAEFERFFDAKDVNKSYGMDCQIGTDASMAFDVADDRMCRVFLRYSQADEKVRIEIGHVENGNHEVGLFDRKNVGEMINATSTLAWKVRREV